MAVLFCIYLMVEEAKSREEDKQGRIRVRIPRSHSMSGLGETPARFAHRQLFMLDLRHKIDQYLFIFPHIFINRHN